MRIIIAIAAAALAVSPAIAGKIDFPELTGRVVDTADEIPADQEAKLESELADFESRTKHQMVVVTVPDLHGVPKEDYAYQIGRYWGIGRKGVDDGIVLLQSPGDGSPGSGKLWIATGYGMEGIVTDADTSGVINGVMVPILKQDRPRSETTPEAIIAGARAMMKIASVTPEQKAAEEAKAKRDAEQAHRRFVAGFWDFVLSVLGLGAVGGSGFGIWMLATRKERARRRAEQAERERIAAEEAAEQARQRAAEQALLAEKRRQEAARQAELQRQREEEARRQREAMLAAMTPADRAAFLAEEERQRQEQERLRREEEERRRRKAEQEREEQERRDEEARKRRAEDDARSAAAASTATNWGGSDSSSSTTFSGGGGSFGGGGAGADY